MMLEKSSAPMFADVERLDEVAPLRVRRPFEPGGTEFDGWSAVVNRLMNGRTVITISTRSSSLRRAELAAADAHRVGLAGEALDRQDRRRSTRTTSTIASADASPTCARDEREHVDLEPGHHGRETGAAAGRDVHDVERRERRDDGHREADADLVAQARER